MKFLTLSFCLLLYGNMLQNKSTYFHLMELNHYYSLKGDYIYSQVVLWNEDPVTGKLQVGAWSIADDFHNAPFPTHGNGIHRWQNSKGQQAHSRLFRESWTQSDPERENKRIFPEDERIGFPNESRTSILRPDAGR